MSLDRKTIKQIGRSNMQKQWGELLLALVLVCVGCIVASLFTFGIGFLVVMGPLAYGLTYMYYRSTQDEKVNQKMLLQGFKERFGDSFLASILVFCAQLIPAVIVGIVMMIVVGISGGIGIGLGAMGYPGGYSVGMGGGGAAMVIGFILWIAAIVVSLFIYYGLVMTVYILMREPGKTAVQAIKKSWAMTKGLKLKLFVFDLSFIGWFLLSALTMWILLIWVAPYYTSSRTVLFNDIYDNSDVEDDPAFEFKSEFGDIKGSVGGLVNKAKPAGKKNEEGADQTTVDTGESKNTDGEYKTCSNCGAKVKAKAKFCNKCGSPM